MHLSKQEKQWLLERKVQRLTDQKEVQIYPMGAERYLASALFSPTNTHYPLHQDIQNKTVLVLPGYGNSSFLFAEAGAKSVLALDKDPLTIAWLKAFKRYYHYRQSPSLPSIAELLKALTAWYPPLLSLASQALGNKFLWLLQPNTLRRRYLHYLLDLVQEAIRVKASPEVELKNAITFEVGILNHLNPTQHFDIAYIPYLLGVKNGIENEADINDFIHYLMTISQKAIITPSQRNKDFYWIGQRYLILKNHQNLRELPFLSSYIFTEDKSWFRQQGLLILRNDL